jgi:two-component system chemotaxis sensor kinase CheA
MNLDEAKQTFVAECHELLQEMEDGLLRLETESHDKDLINALFRAAHTVKGSAGLFELEYIVEFTHLVEGVLDRMREGALAHSNDLTELLLGCRDHIGELVHVTAKHDREPHPELLDAGEKLAVGLRGILGIEAPRAGAQKPASGGTATPSGGGSADESDIWHISLRFGANVLRNGMDPLSFIRYLGKLGEIVHIVTVTDAVPQLAELDAESCHLGFEIRFRSAADKDAIARVFEFVREDSIIRILPPRSLVSEYIEHIRALPEDDARLGQVLVACGAVTQLELEQGLRLQAQPPAEVAGSAKPLGEILVEQHIVRQEVVDTALDRQKQLREKKGVDSQFIRIRTETLDEVINLVGELVIAGASNAMLAQRANQPVLRESAAAVSRLIERIRNRALQLRMVPIGDTFNRFQRVVRDVSKELGKDIQLVITGAETELDKSVVEKITDPLTHLVRNSMDHGIEPQQARLERGKPGKATVRLDARHESGGIVIEVSDDGGGLDRDKILRKAVERGLAVPGQELTERQIFDLLFQPGFSTAEQVTNISGRGVGMDVVRRNIEALHGTVEIESEAGLGTTVRIRLPLTLAIIDGFLVKVGRSSHVIPLEMVTDCLEMTEEYRAATRERNLIVVRGEALPLLRLRDQFEVQAAPPRREAIVVVQHGGRKAGFVVDELLGKLQAVIKPLGKIFSKVPGVSGSTILGSGDVALILDVQALIEQAVSTGSQKAVSAQTDSLASSE